MKLEDIDSNTELDMVSDLINNNYYKDTLNNIYNTSPKTKYNIKKKAMPKVLLK